MKKMIIFFVIIIIIICIIFGLYIDYKSSYNKLKKENTEFEKYLNKEIFGTELTTIINKAINNNEKNEIEKNHKGIYLNNNKNSINIEIKMTDNDKTYQMETIYNGGIQNFVQYYSDIKFKCIEINYHNTNKIKYMLFEQITQ